MESGLRYRREEFRFWMVAILSVLSLMFTGTACLKIKSVEVSISSSDVDSPNHIPDPTSLLEWSAVCSRGTWQHPSLGNRSVTFAKQRNSFGDNLRVFDSKGTLLSGGSSQVSSNYLDTVLPDFKLFIASYDGYDPVNTGVVLMGFQALAGSNMFTNTVLNRMPGMGQLAQTTALIKNTNYIVANLQSFIAKVEIVDNTISLLVPYQEIKSGLSSQVCQNAYFVEGKDAVLLFSVSLRVIALDYKATGYFSSVEPYTATDQSNSFVLDNLDETNVAYGFRNGSNMYTKYGLQRLWNSTNGPFLLIIASLDGRVSETEATFGLNLGQFAYLLVMPTMPQFSNTPLYLLPKDFSALQIIHTFQGLTFGYAGVAGFDITKNKAYFSVVPRENKNFQSYYLLLDTCVERDAGTLVCSKCLDGHHMQEGLANNTCWDYDELPQGLGLNSGGFLLPCPEGCLGCKDNYMKCTECDESKGYILVNGKCPSRSPLRMKSARFNINTRVAKVLFDAALSITQEPNKEFSLLVQDQVEIIEYSCRDLNCRLDLPFSPENGFSITFDTDVTILKGQIKISNDSGLIITRKNDTYPFGDYPILIDIISLTGSNTTSKSTEAMIEALAQAQLPLTLLSLGTGPSVAIIADFLVAQFQYLTLLEGPFLTYPEQVLSMSLNFGLMPFDVSNPFDKLSLPEETCNPTYRFIDNEFACSFTSNYGSDFIVLLGILAVNIVISIATNWLKQWADSKQKVGLSKAAAHVGRSFGLQYFLVKMEGNQMDVILVSLLNFYYMDRSTRLLIGLFPALLMVAYYSSCQMYQFYLGIKLWRAKEMLPRKRTDSFNSLKAEESSVATSLPLDSNQESKSNLKLTEKKGPTKITEVYQEYCTSIEEKPSKASGLFSYVYEDYTVPQTFIWLNLPLANLARSFCLSSLLVAITGRPFHQLSVAMIVEAGYLLFIIKSNIKASRFEFYCECARTVLFILYILLKMISLADMTERTRQSVVGRWMSIILLVVIGISISYALFCLISIVIEVSKNLYQKFNKKNETVEKPEGKAEATSLQLQVPIVVNPPRGSSSPKQKRRVHPTRAPTTKVRPTVSVSVPANRVSGRKLKQPVA